MNGDLGEAVTEQELNSEVLEYDVKKSRWK